MRRGPPGGIVGGFLYREMGPVDIRARQMDGSRLGGFWRTVWEVFTEAWEGDQQDVAGLVRAVVSSGTCFVAAICELFRGFLKVGCVKRGIPLVVSLWAFFVEELGLFSGRSSRQGGSEHEPSRLVLSRKNSWTFGLRLVVPVPRTAEMESCPPRT
jgi:hypothetical protein